MWVCDLNFWTLIFWKNFIHKLIGGIIWLCVRYMYVDTCCSYLCNVNLLYMFATVSIYVQFKSNREGSLRDCWTLSIIISLSVCVCVCVYASAVDVCSIFYKFILKTQRENEMKVKVSQIDHKHQHALLNSVLWTQRTYSCNWHLCLVFRSIFYLFYQKISYSSSVLCHQSYIL